MAMAESEVRVRWTREVIEERLAGMLAAILQIDPDDIDCESRLRGNLGAKSHHFLTINDRIKEIFLIKTNEELFFHDAVSRAAKEHRLYVDSVGALTKDGAAALMRHAPWMRGKWDTDIVCAGVPIDHLMTVGYIMHYLEWALGVTQ